MLIKTIALASLIFLPQYAWPQDPLSSSDRQQLTKGSMVKKVVWKKGYVWPEITILVLLNHTPLENLNLILDFGAHKTFIPDVLESKVIKKISANQTEVYFEMKVPWPVNKSSHITNNIVTNNSDGSYTLKWNLVKGDRLKATDGYMNFSPFEGKTLLKYLTFIVPKSSMAGMFKDRVEKDVEKSIEKIVEHLNATLDK